MVCLYLYRIHTAANSINHGMNGSLRELGIQIGTRLFVNSSRDAVSHDNNAYHVWIVDVHESASVLNGLPSRVHKTLGNSKSRFRVSVLQ